MQPFFFGREGRRKRQVQIKNITIFEDEFYKIKIEQNSKSQNMIVLTAAPLTTCAAYLFLIKNPLTDQQFAIMHHANCSVLQHSIIDKIVKLIKEDNSDLTSVKIKVAIPSGDKLTLAILKKNELLLKEYGFSSDHLQLIEGLESFSVNSQGQTGEILLTPVEPLSNKPK